VTARTQPAPAPAATSSAAPLLAVVVTVLAWASAFVAVRSVGEHLSPGPLALGRLLVGAVVLGLLQLRRAWVRPTGQEWAQLAVCGVGWFGVYNVALNAAERHLDAGTTAMLVNTGPILIALFAGLLLGEGFPRRLVTGLAVAFAGVVVIGLATRSRAADLTGVALCLLAALTYAIGVVAQKPVLRRLPPLQVTAIACAIGMLCCLPWSGELAGQIGSVPAGALAGTVYLGAVPTALAFSTWAYALSRVEAGRLGISTYLVPPVVVLLSWALLHEGPPALAFAGGGVCLAGVALSRGGPASGRARLRRVVRRRLPQPVEPPVAG